MKDYTKTSDPVIQNPPIKAEMTILSFPRRSRGVTNTRPRDFYDVHVLWRIKGAECDRATLAKAVGATCEKRESAARMAQWALVLDDVATDAAMLALWAKYVRKNPYAAGIELPECCETAKAILSVLDV